MAFIHSGFTTSNNHSPALFMMNCGLAKMGLPCVGSWVTYGLGSESRDLPAFVVMSDPKGRGLPKGNASNWSSGFLPGVFQGTYLQPTGDPIANLRRPDSMSDLDQRSQLDFIAALNREHQTKRPPRRSLPRESKASNSPTGCSRPPPRARCRERAGAHSKAVWVRRSSLRMLPDNV